MTTVAEYIAQNFHLRQQSAALEVERGRDRGDPSLYVTGALLLLLLLWYLRTCVQRNVYWVYLMLSPAASIRYQFNPGFYRENPAVMEGMTALLDALRAVPGVEVPREAGACVLMLVPGFSFAVIYFMLLKAACLPCLSLRLKCCSRSFVAVGVLLIAACQVSR